jgi:hypothetical protein
VSTPRAFPALLALAFLLAAAPASSRAEVWAAISGGAYVPTGTTLSGPFETRPAATLSVGYDHGYVGASVWVAFLTTQAGDVLQESALPVVLRLRGRLPLGVVAPYVFGGVGFATARASLELAQYDAVAFTAEAGAGADVYLGDMFALGAEAGYLWLSPSYAFGTVNLGGVVALATFTLRF